MNKKILSEEVQAYIQAHRNVAPTAVALKKSPFEGVSSSELANQIAGWQKTAHKIPDWTAQPTPLYYPDKLNLEQCSSSETGRFKASLLTPGGSLIDLTGGFGVDSYYFAEKAAKVIHCELNTDLSAIVQYNFSALGISNAQHKPGDGIAFLQHSGDTFDYIYIDPSRRVKNQKVFRLEDCEPNILALQDLFFEKGKTIITKLAPLLDISAALNALPAVRDVYVISVDNDCKELLFVQERAYQAEPNIHAIRLYQGQQQEFTFQYSAEKAAHPSFSTPKKYLYEPDVALTKAGAFKSIAVAYGFNKLHPHSHLYTSEQLVEEFPGRVIRVENSFPFAQLKKQEHVPKANVIAKNFPLKVDDIRKKFKIKDGGDLFLYFTTVANGEYIVVVGKRVLYYTEITQFH